MFQVIGLYPDGTEKIHKVFYHRYEAESFVRILNTGCGPCIAKAFGILSIREIIKVEQDIDHG